MAVAAYLVYSLLFSLITAVFFLPGQIRHSIALSTARTTASGQPLPPGYQDSITSIATAGAYLAAGVGLALACVLLLGTILRWRWVYYAQMILGVLAVISIMQSLVGLAGHALALPLPLVLIGVLGSAAAIGLSVWMFVLWRRYKRAWAYQEVTRPIT